MKNSGNTAAFLCSVAGVTFDNPNGESRQQIIKDIIEKKGRKTGKLFYGCSGYPECDVVFWDKPTGDTCPDCGSMLVKTKGKNGTVKCSNPECKYKEKKK